MSENATEFKTCAYCGAKNGSVAQHSGVDECHECWTWRKLDGPAAKHWFKAASMFLSNIDMYDAQTFIPKRCEVDLDAMSAAIKTAEKVKDACKEMLIQHGATERQLDGVLRDTYQTMCAVSYYGRDES